MQSIDLDDVTFDHGDYEIEMNGTSSAYVYMNGSLTIKES